MPMNTGNIGRSCVATKTKLHLIEPLGFRLSDREIKREMCIRDRAMIQDVLGTFSTNFSTGNISRSKNLTNGASKVNGCVLMPGEEFSAYVYLTPFTIANGYAAAGSYENGRVVDTIGGGACQLCTTMYNAALQAEMEITQRQNLSLIHI